MYVSLRYTPAIRRLTSLGLVFALSACSGFFNPVKMPAQKILPKLLQSELTLSAIDSTKQQITLATLEIDTKSIDDQKIIFTTVPTKGVLFVGTRSLTMGDKVSLDDLEPNGLRYLYTHPPLPDDDSRTDLDGFNVSYVASGDTHEVSLNLLVHTPCHDSGARTRYDEIGDGSQDFPFVLCNAHQIDDLGSQTGDPLTKYFSIRTDIDMSSIASPQVIGNNSSGTSQTQFVGSFNGNGHSVSNFAISSTGNYKGLFGYIGASTALLQNLRLVNFRVTGATYVGALAGVIESRSISNVEVFNAQVSGSNWVGGLAGYLKGGTYASFKIHSYVKGTVNGAGALTGGSLSSTINEVQVAGTVAGVTSVGGLIGASTGDTISAALAAVDVQGTTDFIGGMIGSLSNTNVTASGAMGTVHGDAGFVGGFVGQINPGSIQQSWASGAVINNGTTGGFFGNMPNGILIGDYATGSVRGNGNSGGFGGSVPAVGGHGAISKSYATGSVTATGNNIGGFIGNAAAVSGGTININDCYAAGNQLWGDNYVGGFIGRTGNVTIVNAYASNRINHGTTAGGFVATEAGSSTSVSNAYWNVTLSGLGSEGFGSGSAWGSGLTGPHMTLQSSYAFDFGTSTETWSMPLNNTDGVGNPKLNAINKCHGTNFNALTPGGTGTAADPIVICTDTQFMTLAVTPDVKHIRLDASMSLSAISASWPGLGTESAPFTGIFDGNSRNSMQLQSLNLEQSDSTKFLGLFSHFSTNAVGSGGTLFDSYISSSSIYGTPRASGMLVGHSSNAWLLRDQSDIVEVFGYASGGLIGLADTYSLLRMGTTWGASGEGSNITYAASGSGGAVGIAIDSVIEKVTSNGSTMGIRNVGGVVGLAQHSVVSNSHAAGPIEGHFAVGGVVGRLEKGSSVNQSVAIPAGTTFGEDNFGAIFGTRESSNDTYKNNYSIGAYPVMGDNTLSTSVGLAETVLANEDHTSSYPGLDFSVTWTTESDTIYPYLYW